MRFVNRNLYITVLTGITWSVSLLVGAFALFPWLAYADPPPQSPFELPRVFCFRMTDITEVPGDPEGNRFSFEFEILNWSNRDVGMLQFFTNIGSMGNPSVSGATIDPGGRPLGPMDDDGNFPPQDGTSGAKTGTPNNWAVAFQTQTSVLYSVQNASDPPILARDLIGSGSVAAACDLVPGCNLVNGSPVIANPETIDNAVADAFGDDNVLDGFVLDVDGLDPGDLISLNWYLRTPSGFYIGNSSPFGFGVFNIFRAESARGGGTGPAVWTGPPGSNTGTTNSIADMFVSTTPGGANFEIELGAMLLGEPENPADDTSGIPPNATLISLGPANDIPTLSTWGLLLMAAMMLIAGRYFIVRR